MATSSATGGSSVAPSPTTETTLASDGGSGGWRPNDHAAGGTQSTGGASAAPAMGGTSSTTTIVDGGGGHRVEEAASDAGGVQDAGSTESLARANGETCLTDTECQSTHCVDQLCCESACDGQCQACSLVSGGTCTTLLSGQPVGKRTPCTNAGAVCGGSCTGSAGCTYPDSTTPCGATSGCIDSTTWQAGTACDGYGACSPPINVTCSPPDVCNVNTDGRCGKATYTQVGLSDSHTCAVVSDGTLRCWGDNSYAQLGVAGLAPRATPTLVPNLENVSAVTAGWLFTCVLLRSDQVSCWGYDCNGGLGCPWDRESPHQTCIPLASGSKVTEIHAGAEHACARTASGSVQCWGRNDHYQVGDGTTPASISGCGDTNSNRFGPVSVKGVAGAVGLAVNWWHGCAVLGSGAIRCWGGNDNGSVGNGDTVQHATSVVPRGLDGAAHQAVAVATGIDHSCALLRDGSIQCFGANGRGQLGDGTTQRSLVPISLSAPVSARGIAAGAGFTCALSDTSTIQCWGAGTGGELGNGAWLDSPVPVAVRFPESGVGITFSSLVTKIGHTCALTTAGSLWCWSGNSSGQLGDGTTAASNLPVEVPSPDRP